VKRYDEIQQFKPEKYWKLDVRVREQQRIASLNLNFYLKKMTFNIPSSSLW